jgi:predicted nucleic acid-binding protein
MIVVSNSTPLISLAKIDRFDLLKAIFSKVHISQGVYEEVVVEGEGLAGAREVSDADWIEIVEVSDKSAVEELQGELDKGESEVIVLARELGADWLLLDERLARQKAKALRFKVIGTLGILLRAKEMRLIETVKPEMDQLRARGIRISGRVYEQVLSIAQEGDEL